MFLCCFIDTFAVAECVRGNGIGRKLLKAVAGTYTGASYCKLRLNTERTRPDYKIYKHLGFEESKLVQMECYQINGI